jgi:phage tail-like protein
MPESHPSFRYTVLVDGVPFLYCSEVVLPTLTTEIETVKEGGLMTYVHKLPKGVDAGTVKLKHAVAHIDFMLTWYMIAYYGGHKIAQRTLIIVMQDSLLIPVARWMFNDALPIKWTGPTLQAASSTISVEELELAHSGFIVTPM